MFPKEFKIFGQTIKINLRKGLVKKHNAVGLWHTNKNSIDIQMSVKDYPMHQELQEQTLWHEIAHCILERIGHEELSNDEVFVDRLGQALHQVVKTLK